MKIIVFGTGGVGGYFGGKLAQAGNDVTFIARGKHLESIQQNGLEVKSIQGNFTIKPAKVTSDIQAINKADLVILAVKSWHLFEIEKELRALCGANTVFLPLENGISAPEFLSNIIPPHQVLGGLCKIFSNITAPGVIHHSGYIPSITFGELNNTTSERVMKIHELLNKAGIKNHIAENIESEMWKKFLFIVSTSAMGAITRTPIGTFRSIPESRSLLVQILHEIVAVGKAANVKLPENSAEKTLAFIDKMPEDSTTSMQRDIMEGKPSELEAQLGEVISLGKKLKVNAPIATTIYNALLPQENIARAKI